MKHLLNTLFVTRDVYKRQFHMFITAAFKQELAAS